MEKTKHKILKYLFTKLDNIKLELYNIYKYRNRIRILYDFEKDSRIVSHENKFIIRNEIKKSKQVNVIKEVKDYLSEIKWLPIYKILKESRKIVFFDEYLYLLREGYINKLNFLKESKNNNFLCKANDKDSLNKKVEDEICLYHKERITEKEKKELIYNKIEKKKKELIENEELKEKEKRFGGFTENYNNDLVIKRRKISDQVLPLHKHQLKSKYVELFDELGQYFLLKNRFFPASVNLNLKNYTNGYLFLSKNTSLNIDLPVYKKDTNIISTYKNKISLYKYCKSRTSLYYKFTKVIQTSGLHQSFKKINEKFIYSSVREMSKNRGTLDYEESSVDLSGFNIESNNPIPSISTYQQGLSSSEGFNLEVIEGDECEVFYPFFLDGDE